MAIEFEVEHTFSVDGRGVFVAVRLLTSDSAFTLSDTPTLGAIPVERWLDQPRTIKPDGTARTDQFVFKLVRPEDRDAFHPGQRVRLE